MLPCRDGRPIAEIVCHDLRVIPAFLFDDYLEMPMLPPPVSRSTMFSSPFTAFIPPSSEAQLSAPYGHDMTELVEAGLLVVEWPAKRYVPATACRTTLVSDHAYRQSVIFLDALRAGIVWMECPPVGTSHSWDLACEQALTLLNNASKAGVPSMSCGITYHPEDSVSG